MSTIYGVRIDHDTEEPIDDDAETPRLLADGTFKSYLLTVVTQCEQGHWHSTPHSIGSVVTFPTTLVGCVVTDVREIGDKYLREIAHGLLQDAAQ
jgi:hypothetical protein